MGIKLKRDKQIEGAKEMSEMLCEPWSKTYVAEKYSIRFTWRTAVISSFHFYYDKWEIASRVDDRGKWNLNASFSTCGRTFYYDIIKVPMYVLKYFREALKLERVEFILDDNVTLVDETEK